MAPDERQAATPCCPLAGLRHGRGIPAELAATFTEYHFLAERMASKALVGMVDLAQQKGGRQEGPSEGRASVRRVGRQHA